MSNRISIRLEGMHEKQFRKGSGYMTKTKNHIFKGVFAALTATALIAGVMTGCGKSDSSSSGSGDTKETQVVTEVVSGILVDENGQPITDEKGNFISATEADKTDADKKQSSGSEQKSKTESGSQKSDTSSKSQGGSQKSDTSSKSQGGSQKSDTSSKSDGSRTKTPSGAKTVSTTKKSSADTSAKALTIGGKEYKVGDKVICTYFLEVPQTMLNFQGELSFDSSMLKKTNSYLVAPATYSSIINNNLNDRVVFNGSDLSGYDFSSPGYEFLVVEYEVLKTGTTEPAFTFEVLTDVDDKPYADASSGKLINGAKLMAVYS